MPSDQRCELIDGELIMLSPAGDEHGFVAANIAILLGPYVKRRRLGRVYGAETGFILRRNPDTVRAPDAAFVQTTRLRPPGERRGFFPGAPDFAAEVVSPDDSRREMHEKALGWIEAGARLVWVVWPDERQVTVYRPGCEPVMLDAGQTLDGADVVPGFTCGVAELFE